jgi:peptidoglycan/xylan/chitin deacetylase (PgdA/CDA1 family)
VVTFDDGYEDNYINARPILEKLNVPATIFVSSGYSGTKREFWWDELERLILAKESLPDEINIELGGEKHSWKVLTSRGRANVDENLSSPHDIYSELCARFQSLSAEEIDEGIGQLREMTNDNGEARLENIPMSKEQLRSLSGGRLIEIGAHTRSHINLAAQNANRQWDEIEGSKKDLEQILGKPIESFSYPFGTLDHYTDTSIKCVRDVGFKNALSNYTGNVTRLTSLYEIPRRMVRNWDDIVFKEKIGAYYNGRLKAAANIV